MDQWSGLCNIRKDKGGNQVKNEITESFNTWIGFEGNREYAIPEEEQFILNERIKWVEDCSHSAIYYYMLDIAIDEAMAK
jgi:hypothetical protein